jgi:hypothetical protein
VIKRPWPEILSFFVYRRPGGFTRRRASLGDGKGDKNGAVARLQTKKLRISNSKIPFPGAPVKPFYGAGDERIVVVHF